MSETHPAVLLVEDDRGYSTLVADNLSNRGFDVEDDGAILLKATNDGKAPSKDTVKSLGSRLFDDLAQCWSLTRHGKTTVLLAKLASTS